MIILVEQVWEGDMLLKLLKLCALILLIIPMIAFGAHFENLIDLTIKVEDGSFTIRVKSLQFNGEEIKLDPSDMFKPRKIMQYKLSPGRYILNWSTEKNPVKWTEESAKNFEKILVLEHGDGIVRVNIKGETITMY